MLRFAADPADTREIRSEKLAILIMAGSCSIAGIVWSSVYVVVFGWGYTASLPLAFTLIVGSSLLIAHRTRNHYVAVYGQIICIIGITALIQWSIGGVFDSGFVVVWAFVGPLTALMFFSPRQSTLWFAAFLAVLIVTVVFDGYFADRALEVSTTTSLVFFGMNLGVMSAVTFVFSRYFVSEALAERARANNLLLNVLPSQIAEQLKSSDDTIAARSEGVSVLFADIVGSTPLFEDLEPGDVVDWLNEVYSALDAVVARHGLEKIRTIGDNYMVASGVPVPRDDHAEALVRCALEMVDTVVALPARDGKRIELRMGINSGPAVAGVIGRTKFHYDIWGDTVNVASRMESHGEPGRVHVTASTKALLDGRFTCTPRGLIDVKGKGPMETWFVDLAGHSSP